MVTNLTQLLPIGYANTRRNKKLFILYTRCQSIKLNMATTALFSVAHEKGQLMPIIADPENLYGLFPENLEHYGEICWAWLYWLITIHYYFKIKYNDKTWMQIFLPIWLLFCIL